MFRNTATAEAGEIEQGDSHGDHADLVPMSHLSLDLPAMTAGWQAELERRGIVVVLDDLGRQAVSRGDARRLFDEHREMEMRRQEVAQRIELAAIEKDRAFRAQLWTGIPADLMPPGAAPAAVMLQLDKDAQPRRQSVLQEALSHDSGLTFHSLAPTPDGDAS
jgi:hypothetical protein